MGKNDFPKIQVGVNSPLSEREDDSHWQHRGKKMVKNTFAFNFNGLFFNFEVTGRVPHSQPSYFAHPKKTHHYMPGNFYL